MVAVAHPGIGTSGSPTRSGAGAIPVPRGVRGGPLVLSALLLLPANAAVAQLVEQTSLQRVQTRAADTAANPFLSFLPEGVEPDLDGWRRFVADLGTLRRSVVSRAPSTFLPVAEVEAPGEIGLNDFDVSAEWLPRRGAAAGWRIDGRLDRPAAELAVVGDLGGSSIDGLDLSSALAGGARLALDALVGDGIHGSGGTGSGDFDVACFEALAGETLVASVSTPTSGQPGAGLDPFLALYDGAGVAIAFEDEIIEGGFFVSVDAQMEQRLPLDDRYCLFVGGSIFDGQILPADPTDAGSGPGVVSEGAYRLEIAVDPPDRFGRDLFAFSVDAGDIVAATVREGAGHRIGLLGADGEELVASSFDLSGLYPAASPLPAGGVASVAYVMPRSQTVFLSVQAASAFGLGPYGVELGLFRAPPEVVSRGRGPGAPTIHRVVLEFDGGLVDRSLFFGGVLAPEFVSLSPLALFLSRWGLGPGHQDLLVERIVAVTREELVRRVARLGSNGDWLASGTAGEFALEVVGGQGIEAEPGDVRLVIGGTVDELRLQTIGIAETIDPGNFEKTKLAVVLLDLVSAPRGDANSVNSVDLAPGATRLEAVATVVGRIAAHEAGHLLGNFHTERDVGPATIMDSGGRLDLLLGLGDDGVFGSGDDLGVHLGPDEYSRREPFRGLEPTLEVLSHGLPVGVGERLRVEPRRLDFGAVPVGASAVRSFEVRNEGTQTRTVRPGGSGGCGACTFGLSETSFPLASGERRLVEVTFAPLASGPARLSLPVEVDGPATVGATLVELTGVGGNAALAGLPGEPIFPPILYPGPAESRAQVRLLNLGEVAIEPAVRLQGAQADRFRIAEATRRGLDQDLPPGEEIVLELIFDPRGAVGEAKASLWLLDALRAATALEIPLRARSDGPDLALGPRPYVFGALRADGASGRRSFRIENRGTRPLRVDFVELGAATPSEFVLTPPETPRDLAPGQTVFAPVVFAPSEAVVYRGELVVGSNDPDEPRAVAEMLGLGLLPMIDVWPSPVRLGAVAPGQTVDGIVFRVANLGGATLNGSLELNDPTGAWTVTPEPGGLRLAPDSSAEFMLSYTAPGARGAASGAELVIRSDDRDRPEVRVPLVVGSVLEIPLGGPLPALLLVVLLALAAANRLRC